VTTQQPRPASAEARAAGRASALAESAGAELDVMLAEADRALAREYPGERHGRQPVHTAYIPADVFRPGLAADWGRRALQALETWAPDPAEFGAAMNVPAALAAGLRSRVAAKLAAEPVEDLRLDFEDGYHPHANAVEAEDADARAAGDAHAAEDADARAAGDAHAAEDADARAAAKALADAIAAGAAPPFTGLRCKSLEPGTRRRAIRTLDLFLASLLRRGPLPAGFVVTLPKVTSAAQVEAMAHLCDRLEQAHALTPGRLVFEVQVETPQIVLNSSGAATVARCVHAARGRLVGLHYGTYDYSASLGIAAAYQSIEHPAADHARAVMQVAAAGTGVRLSDGSSNVLPVGTREEVVAAWQLHAALVRRSLERGFYQGWDLHPAQLASRYAATYAFFREGLPESCARLRSYLGSARRGLLEEPATARALAGYLARGLDCGAVSPQEIAEMAGLGRAELDALRATGRPQA
jgi:citrate lyase beta subunit